MHGLGVFLTGEVDDGGAGGIGIGFGATKFAKLVRGGGLWRALASVRPPPQVAVVGGSARAKLRAALLRLDPSLEENEGAALGLRDLGGPFGKKKKRRGS